MGAAAICFAAKQLQGVNAFVLESCYVDIGTAFANRLQHGYPNWYKRLSRGVADNASGAVRRQWNVVNAADVRVDSPPIVLPTVASAT